MPAENGVIAIFVYASNSSCFAHLEHEILRWKLWDQNFVAFDSGNIRIKESKKKKQILLLLAGWEASGLFLADLVTFTEEIVNGIFIFNQWWKFQ